MADPALTILVNRHLATAAATLGDLPGVDLDAYAEDLANRFANPHLAHETYQIAMDGSEKMPQRIFAPAKEALRRHQPLDAFAFATAAWMRYTLGHTEDGKRYDLRDPLEAKLRPEEDSAFLADRIMERLGNIPGLIPHDLCESDGWNRAVRENLERILRDGMPSAIAQAAARRGEVVSDQFELVSTRAGSLSRMPHRGRHSARPAARFFLKFVLE